MINLLNVSYVRIGTRDLDGAKRFVVDYLGLEIAERYKGGICFKSDARAHTLCYFEGSPSDQAVAFEVRDREDLEEAAAQLDRLGYVVRLGTESEAAARCVKSFIAFNDPSGNAIELVYRPAQSGRRYRGSRDAGITGFSHVGLCSSDVVRDELFWTTICNARVSDRIGDAPLLRIDEVHHSIALFPSGSKGIQHINHQVQTGDDVMRSYHFLNEKNVPMVFGPGRHPSSSAASCISRGPRAWYSNILRGLHQSPMNCFTANASFPSSRKGSATGVQSRVSSNFEVTIPIELGTIPAAGVRRAPGRARWSTRQELGLDPKATVIPGRCEASNYDVQLYIGESRDSGFALVRAPE